MTRDRSRIAAFAAFAARRTGLALGDYPHLWRWSVEDLDSFWATTWDFFGLPKRPDGSAVLANDNMPGAVWFPDVTLNFVEEIFRERPPTQTALIGVDETDTERSVTWSELESLVASAASGLRNLGVRRGDRVVGYLSNNIEAVAAFLATASLGAIWALCGSDYTPAAAAGRLAQLQPRVLIAASAHRYGGRDFDDTTGVRTLREACDSEPHLVWVGGRSLAHRAGESNWTDLISDTGSISRPHSLEPELVAFNHPLWVLFSSGTTGPPKGIVHSHGGVVLEHLKLNGLHLDLGPGDRMLWYTTPSWMMWNALVCALLVGASIVCVDGSPSYPDVDRLYSLAARTGTTLLGTSPAYLTACQAKGVRPREHDLQHLRTVGVTGSTFSTELYQWLEDSLPASITIATTSGGTDIVTALAGPSPWSPSRPGALGAACLGVALDSYDAAGSPVRDCVGELVVTRPMPSMPVAFWNDPDGRRLRDSYYSTYPGIWRHGDWITVADDGSVVIHGRSDATLNRRGIRIGSADIYNVVESLPFVSEALVVGLDKPGGGYWMPLFVVIAEDGDLTDEHVADIRAAISSAASPRHLPDEIIAVSSIPHTRTGKKLEVPVKRILAGEDIEQVVDLNAVDAPNSVRQFVQLGIRHREKTDNHQSRR